MVDHSQQQLTARDMVRAHTYPVLIPQAVKNHRTNRCIDAHIAMRASINPKGDTTPGKMIDYKAVEHC